MDTIIMRQLHRAALEGRVEDAHRAIAEAASAENEAQEFLAVAKERKRAAAQRTGEAILTFHTLRAELDALNAEVGE